ncbi:putative bifunctional diguanylate cyclase/phosphodiesterase [Marinobacterium rhizophilum]|uniref:EAL domain-containing protein n=1 Tax=Marinobacterium rhizophilum TaxID=420402 RepID=A0ABY5HJ95_9GAMM|nr:EAL domain-containing protein [Marinobacterium rhizophilum]UTW11359.1 EAL domain-containing protein [Marinobacterium rhizophilum]
MRLASRFILIVSGILSVTLALNAYYFIHSQSQLLEQQLNERGRVLGHLIALISPDAMLSFDFLTLNEYAREVSRQRDVVYGVIVNDKGTPLTSFFNEQDPRVLDALQALGLDKETAPLTPPKTARLVARLSSSLYDLLPMEFPISHGERPLGQLKVGISREQLHAQTQKQLLIQSSIYGLIILFLCSAIFWVFRYNVMGPVNRLMNASRNAGQGELEEVTVTSRDELGSLAETFNAMVHAIREEQAKLHYQANYDALTALPNRMMAIDRLDHELRLARRHNELVAVIFIDLDNFKVVNDTMGHAAGDELLAMLGARLLSRLRDVDTLARLGGDEFLVLLPRVQDIDEVKQIATRLLEATSERLLVHGREVIVHCSIGIALYPDDGISAEELMANADNAMYQAKTPAHLPICFFTQEMNVRVRERLQLEQDLHLAVERGELELYFQPIVQSGQCQPVGAEVLLRWQHPQNGIISPATFIPLAEASGLIVTIGDWVLRQACSWLRHWLDLGLTPGPLAINISRLQLQDRLVTVIRDLASEYRIATHMLELEMTENILLDDHVQVSKTLDQLQAMGIKLSLDDFGTGYSSLSYLRRFSFDALKIDRSFIQGLPQDQDGCALIGAIVVMAHRLGLRVVAEGVETVEQRDFLRQQGCDFLQGYLLGRPMTASAYQATLPCFSAANE